MKSIDERNRYVELAWAQVQAAGRVTSALLYRTLMLGALFCAMASGAFAQTEGSGGEDEIEAYDMAGYVDSFKLVDLLEAAMSAVAKYGSFVLSILLAVAVMTWLAASAIRVASGRKRM